MVYATEIEIAHEDPRSNINFWHMALQDGSKLPVYLSHLVTLRNVVRMEIQTVNKNYPFVPGSVPERN